MRQARRKIDRVLAAAELRPASLPELRRTPGGRGWRKGPRSHSSLPKIGASRKQASIARNSLLSCLRRPVRWGGAAVETGRAWASTDSDTMR